MPTAAGLQMDGGNIKSAGLALGGVALKSWKKAEAESALIGKPAKPENFQRAAALLLEGAKGYEHNAFKIELVRNNIVRALTLAAQGTPEEVNA